MAIRPNWGVGRNLRLKVFEDGDIDALAVQVNAWFVGLTEEEILDVHFSCDTYGDPAVDHLHLIVLYTEE